MKKMKPQSLLLLIPLFFFSGMFAQVPLEFDQLIHVGGLTEDLVLDLVTDSEGGTYVLLLSESDVLYSNDSIIGINPSAYMLKYGLGGILAFSYEFNVQGENPNIFMHKLGILNNGHVVCTGSFRGEFQFGDTIVERTQMSGFICSFSPD